MTNTDERDIYFFCHNVSFSTNFDIVNITNPSTKVNQYATISPIIKNFPFL